MDKTAKQTKKLFYKPVSELYFATINERPRTTKMLKSLDTNIKTVFLSGKGNSLCIIKEQRGFALGSFRIEIALLGSEHISAV